MFVVPRGARAPHGIGDGGGGDEACSAEAAICLEKERVAVLVDELAREELATKSLYGEGVLNVYVCVCLYVCLHACVYGCMYIYMYV